MIEELRELWRFRELLLTMVQRELRVRYKNSALGFLWSFINPLITTLVLTVVFGRILNNGVPNFSAYVLAALLPFYFFQNAMLDSAQSVLSSLPIIKKVYFPREILPLASIISNFIHLLMGFVVFFAFLLFIWIKSPGANPFQWTIVYVPFLMVISLCLATGLGLLVSALNTFYEDVKYVVGVMTYLLFFLCPVMYFYEEVANSGLNKSYWLFKLYNLNPIAVLSVAYRKALVAPVEVHLRGGGIAAPSPMPWNYLAYSAVLSFVVLIYGYHVFNQMKWRFVERP